MQFMNKAALVRWMVLHLFVALLSPEHTLDLTPLLVYSCVLVLYFQHCCDVALKQLAAKAV